MAIAWPIPEDAPVIKIFFPCSYDMIPLVPYVRMSARKCCLKLDGTRTLRTLLWIRRFSAALPSISNSQSIQSRMCRQTQSRAVEGSSSSTNRSDNISTSSHRSSLFVTAGSTGSPFSGLHAGNARWCGSYSPPEYFSMQPRLQRHEIHNHVGHQFELWDRHC